MPIASSLFPARAVEGLPLTRGLLENVITPLPSENKAAVQTLATPSQHIDNSQRPTHIYMINYYMYIYIYIYTMKGFWACGRDGDRHLFWLCGCCLCWLWAGSLFALWRFGCLLFALGGLRGVRFRGRGFSLTIVIVQFVAIWVQGLLSRNQSLRLRFLGLAKGWQPPPPICNLLHYFLQIAWILQ